MSDPANAYAAAGVSIEAGDKAVELMKVWIFDMCPLCSLKTPSTVSSCGISTRMFTSSPP